MEVSDSQSVEPLNEGDTVLAGIYDAGTANPQNSAATSQPAKDGTGTQYQPSKPTLYRGTDDVIRMPKAQEPVRYLGDAVSLNFEQAPLLEVVHAVMGDILELDYFVEHPINGLVTLRTRTPVPRDQLLEILESLLQANNALMIRDKDGRFFVSASGRMSKLKPSIAASTAGVVGYSTVIIPLEFISAASMAEILRPVTDETAFVRIDNLRNILMLAGTRAQLEGWQEMITTFDVDLLKGMSVGVFPVENASIADVDEALGSLLGKDGEDGAAAGTGIGSVVRIIPVERLNSILVVTPRVHYLKRIQTWIERLDQAPDANFERRLHVYPVQNTSATHLADLLSTIYSGGGSSSGGGRRSGGVAPGFTPESVSSDGASGSSSSGNSAPKSKNYSVGDVRIVADEVNNALLIYATGKEFQKIQPALDQLDVAATQVIIEASIIEVTLNDDLRYGLEWSFNGGIGNGYTGVGRQRDDTPIGPVAPGFSYTAINGSGVIKAALNAFASDDLLNVISSPSVMVLDNQTATIQVGNQIPIRSSTTQNEFSTVQSIEYRDTGVKLSVTPSVNAGGMVTMDIEQSVTDVGNADAVSNERSFLERSIKSKVAVRSSESVVLGGLILENRSVGSSGVPFLHEIPILGGLFGNKVQENTRTELLVIITPRVIYSESELRAVSTEMREQMRGLDLIDVSDSSSFLMEKDSP